MATAFLVTFVDAIEAFLVVAVAVAFVRKTRQTALVSAVRWGIAASVVVSAFGAWWMAQAGNFAQWERRFAALAVFAIVGFATFMWRRRELLTDTPGTPPVSTHLAGWAALFLFTILVLSREGMHTLLLLAIFVVQVPVIDLRFSVVSAVAVAAGLSWAWAHYGQRVRRPAFAAASIIILLLATSRLVLDALRTADEPPRLHFQLIVPPEASGYSGEHGKASNGRVADVGG